MDKNTHISDNMLNAFLQAMDLDGKEILDVEQTVNLLSARKEFGWK